MSPFYRDSELPQSGPDLKSFDPSAYIANIEKFVDSGRLGVLLVGPGLGRHPAVAQMALRLIRKATSKNIPLGKFHY